MRPPGHGASPQRALQHLAPLQSAHMGTLLYHYIGNLLYYYMETLLHVYNYFDVEHWKYIATKYVSHDTTVLTYLQTHVSSNAHV